jgi:hypothetical protein
LNSMLFWQTTFGPDAKASLTIQETKELVLAVKNIAAAGQILSIK